MKIRLCIGLVLLVALSSGSAAAQTWPGSGSIAGDPRVLEDGAECIEAVARLFGTACSVLYFHVFDPLSTAPVTLQRPADCADDIATGFRTPGMESFWDLNDVEGTAVPSIIHYGDCEGSPNVHWERGIAADITIDTDAPIYGYWYLSVDTDELAGVPDMAGPGPDVGIAPCLTLRMTLWAGQTHVEKGTIIAAGETTKTIVSARAAGDGSDAPLARDAACPFAGRGDVVYPEAVTEFQVLLQPFVPPDQNLPIPAKNGLSLRAEWYQFSPGDPDEQGEKVYPANIDLHTGPLYPNRVLLPVRDTLRIERFDATPWEGKLALEINATSAWGSYDLDAETLRLEVRGADGYPLPLHHLDEPVLRYSLDHDGSFRPLYAVLPWDVLAEDLLPGPYTLTVAIQNHQHTAKAERSVEILVGDNGFMVPPDTTLYGVPQVERNGVPGPSMSLLAAGLVVVAVAYASTRRPFGPKKP